MLLIFACCEFLLASRRCNNCMSELLVYILYTKKVKANKQIISEEA